MCGVVCGFDKIEINKFISFIIESGYCLPTSSFMDYESQLADMDDNDNLIDVSLTKRKSQIIS